MNRKAKELKSFYTHVILNTESFLYQRQWNWAKGYIKNWGKDYIIQDSYCHETLHILPFEKVKPLFVLSLGDQYSENLSVLQEAYEVYKAIALKAFKEALSEYRTLFFG